MSDQYKLYKLRSGEEIIAKIVSKTSKKVILFRPMQVKIQSLIDREGGMMRDIVLLRRWLDNTFEINCELPLDYVAVELKPTPDIYLNLKKKMHIMMLCVIWRMSVKTWTQKNQFKIHLPSF